MRRVNGFDDFVANLLEAGFSIGGGMADNIYSVVPYTWGEAPPYPTRVRWHTGNPETDPWEWRLRVLNERDDIAYAKCFFKKSGYITREWYPRFLAARRKGRGFEEEYADGEISHEAKRIYEAVKKGGAVPLHDIKVRAGFKREDKSRFDAAIIDLQMRLHLTICGSFIKVSKAGAEYGWESTVFSTVEAFWGDDVLREADALDPDDAAEEIAARVFELNPGADRKRLPRFIYG